MIGCEKTENPFFLQQNWRKLEQLQVGGSVSNGYVILPQEDISRLRRKLETTKKPDNVPKCDEILMEEIKDYKVRKTESVIAVCFFCQGLKWPTNRLGEEILDFFT